MRQPDIKRFAVLFSVLLLLQDTHAKLTINIDKNQNERSKRGTKAKDFVEAETDEDREKRFFNGLLLITSGVSGGLDIYRQELGCTEKTPDLDDNVALINVKQAELVEMKDSINVRWVTVEEKERYLDLLDKDFGSLVQQIEKFDELQMDILTKIDPQLLTKFDLVRANIENAIDSYNETQLEDPNYLVAQYYTAEQFALLLSLKFGSIALYVGGRVYNLYKQYRAYQQFQRVTQNIATRARSNAVANLAESNPSLKFKLTLWASSKWASFKAKWPRTTNVASKIKYVIKLPFVSRNPVWLGIKSFVAGAAKAGLTIFLIVYEIWNFMAFDKECHDNLRRSEEMLDEMDEHKQNMTRTMQEIDDLETGLDQEFVYQKNNLTSEDFMALVNEVISLGENSENETEADELTNATKNIQYYIDNIADADYLETNSLNGILISAFLSINYSLDCVRAKLSIIASVFQDCLAGNGDMESIYADAKKLEKQKVEDDCITNGYFTYEDIVNVTAEAMILYNASTVCIRNNVFKQLLVCGDWYDNIDKGIIASTRNVTEDDVDYFIALCEPGDITQTIAESICSKKAEKVDSNDISVTFYKFYNTQILAAYDACNLTTSDQEKICSMKREGYSYGRVIEEFSLYAADDVGAVYNNCALATEVSPGDGFTICQYKNLNFTFDGKYASLWDPLISEYGLATIETYIENNCPDTEIGDAMERKDHKTSIVYHEYDSEAITTKLQDPNRKLESFNVDKQKNHKRKFEEVGASKQEDLKREDEQELIGELEKILWN